MSEEQKQPAPEVSGAGMDDMEGEGPFKCKCIDSNNSFVEVPRKIVNCSTFFKELADNDQQEDFVSLTDQDTQITEEALNYIVEHMKIWDFKPDGVKKGQSFTQELQKNIAAKDMEHVKQLWEITPLKEKFEQTAKYVKILAFLGAQKLKQVYLAIFLTEFTLEGTSIPELNAKFAKENLFVDKKWETYEDLTEDRLEELKKKFPFMDKDKNPNGGGYANNNPQPMQEDLEIGGGGNEGNQEEEKQVNQPESQDINLDRNDAPEQPAEAPAEQPAPAPENEDTNELI